MIRLAILVICMALVAGCGGSSAPSVDQSGGTDTGIQGSTDTSDMAPSPDDASGSFDARGDSTAGADLERPTPDVVDGDLETPQVELPKDEGQHDAEIEWWYYTGRLQSEDGEVYGFEFVTFKERQLGIAGYLWHAAISDVKGAAFHLAHELSLVPQSQPAHGFDFGIKSWRMTGGGGHDKLSFDVGGFSAKLELEAKKPVVLQYGNGAMLLGASDPFYYYSYTRMSVSGTLIVDGVEKSVSGTAWMDHQWGALGQNFDGWDWYSVRLDDNTELMLFRVRGDQHIAGGTYIHADGSYDEIPPGGFSVDVTGKWHSPHTDSTYPLGWVIKVPQYDLEVTVTPQISDQEFYVSSFGSPKYWEGLCTVVGTRGGQGVSGHAYVELTGYAK